MALSRLVRLPNGQSKTFWPRYRGKRGGSLVKSGENDPCHLISVAQPRDLNRVAKLPRLDRFRNLANLISVTNKSRRTLDLILTDISQYYQDPIERPPFGLSDHASIELQPKERAHVKQPTITMKERDLRPSKHQSTGTYLEAVDVCTMTCPLETFAA
ncbi:hypothetical protein P5673_009036 [Acropora cervicornis]|uniref:Uncharacterized protein n=1 Tax=Acropora cervicornis TaxID=6130 RepID=A0AAD9QTR2_ACRCE|nr:hypothetical protein P5673_009036 [Acropora cervicornis]